MRQHVGRFQGELERVRLVRLVLWLALDARVGALIEGQVFDIRELLMNVERGTNSRPQKHNLVRFVGRWIDRDLRRIEVIVEWDWRPVHFFLLGPPAEPHIRCDTHARLDQGHRLELFEQAASGGLVGDLGGLVLFAPLSRDFGTLRLLTYYANATHLFVNGNFSLTRKSIHH